MSEYSDVSEPLVRSTCVAREDRSFAQPTPEELEVFKAQVSEWLKLDDQVRKLAVAVRERRVHQRALASNIQSFMIKYGYDNLNTQHGRICAVVRQVRQPLRLTDIRTKILEYQGLTGEQLIDRIFQDQSRPSVQQTSLRRIMPKVSMHLEI